MAEPSDSPAMEATEAPKKDEVQPSGDVVSEKIQLDSRDDHPETKNMEPVANEAQPAKLATDVPGGSQSADTPTATNTGDQGQKEAETRSSDLATKGSMKPEEDALVSEEQIGHEVKVPEVETPKQDEKNLGSVDDIAQKKALSSPPDDKGDTKRMKTKGGVLSMLRRRLSKTKLSSSFDDAEDQLKTVPSNASVAASAATSVGKASFKGFERLEQSRSEAYPDQAADKPAGIEDPSKNDKEPTTAISIQGDDASQKKETPVNADKDAGPTQKKEESTAAEADPQVNPTPSENNQVVNAPESTPKDSDENAKDTEDKPDEAAPPAPTPASDAKPAPEEGANKKKKKRKKSLKGKIGKGKKDIPPKIPMKDKSDKGDDYVTNLKKDFLKKQVKKAKKGTTEEKDRRLKLPMTISSETLDMASTISAISEDTGLAKSVAGSAYISTAGSANRSAAGSANESDKPRHDKRPLKRVIPRDRAPILLGAVRDPSIASIHTETVTDGDTETHTHTDTCTYTDTYTKTNTNTYTNTYTYADTGGGRKDDYTDTDDSTYESGTYTSTSASDNVSFKCNGCSVGPPEGICQTLTESTRAFMSGTRAFMSRTLQTIQTNARSKCCGIFLLIIAMAALVMVMVDQKMQANKKGTVVYDEDTGDYIMLHEGEEWLVVVEVLTFGLSMILLLGSICYLSAAAAANCSETDTICTDNDSLVTPYVQCGVDTAQDKTASIATCGNPREAVTNVGDKINELISSGKAAFQGKQEDARRVVDKATRYFQAMEEGETGVLCAPMSFEEEDSATLGTFESANK